MLPVYFSTLALLAIPQQESFVPLFDGASLSGWESADENIWRVENGSIVGGALDQPTPQNSYLFFEEEFDDFELRLQFLLQGFPKQGMVNSGVQFRSEQVNGGGARGYQADIGDPTWWGSLYDEHRRDRVLASSDMNVLGPSLNREGWNDYAIRCEGPRVRLWINGILTVDYLEQDSKVPQAGKIAFQLHSGGPVQVSFREITLAKITPIKSPRTPSQEQASFRVPDGFVVELVASEESGLPKPITVQFDDAGRMWSMTATEYPLDANENPAKASELWQRGGKDRVVYFDNPCEPGPHPAKTFADGLAMPMGLLPWENGVILGQGSEILFLEDESGDGQADKRRTLLTGFGVQDSHLMPHQFTLMPSGWIAMAQGAFNFSKVIAGKNKPVEFNYCKLGRFLPDGSKFEIIGYGFNNIWGLAVGREGEVFIQEANDMKYSVVPFQNGATYPGIGNEKFRPYSPISSPIADFYLGGTGLSGLALSDNRSGGFPDPWASVMFVANPITGTINAVKVSNTESGEYSATRLPDFLTSADGWFRPIAISFGPDGCLYVVDWYNEIISHNEVPREHPARDRSRGRIWRVRHESQARKKIPNLTQSSDAELVNSLTSDSTWEMRAAWRQIMFRQANGQSPALTELALDPNAAADSRIHALWALKSLGPVDPKISSSLLESKSRNLRREALRVQDGWMASSLVDDPDPQVRAEAIRSLLRQVTPSPEQLLELIRFAKPSMAAVHASDIPWNGRHGIPVPTGSAYNREFERFLVRRGLEEHPAALAKLLSGPLVSNLPLENRLFASLALPSNLISGPFLQAWRDMDRLPDEEELVLLLQGASNPEYLPLVQELFSDPKKASGLMNAILRMRSRLKQDQIENLLTLPLRKLAEEQGQEALLVEMVSVFQLEMLKDVVVQIFSDSSNERSLRASALTALRRIGAGADPAVLDCLTSTDVPSGLRRSSLIAIGESGEIQSTPFVLEEIKILNTAGREEVVEGLSSSIAGASLLLEGVALGSIPVESLSPIVLARMAELLPDDPFMQKLWKKESRTLPSALHLFGKPDQFSATQLSLSGPFTLEAWVRLAEGISNADGILGRPGGADLNFHDSRARFYGGPAVGDLVIANRSIVSGIWTHVAVSRDAEGVFRVFLDGELDNTGTKKYTETFTKLDFGRTSPPQEGTHGELMEFRIWNYARSNFEIRSSFRHKLDHGAQGLIYSFPRDTNLSQLAGGARLTPVASGPRLLDATRAAEQEQELDRFRAIAAKPGVATRGEPLFTALCLSCHTIGGKGGGVAPPLDGSANREFDAVLRAVVTPNAAFEPGYRVYRLETHAGRMYEGFLVKIDNQGTTLGFMGGNQVFVEAKKIRQGRFLNRSFMPTGILDSLDDQSIADLFGHISSLE